MNSQTLQHSLDYLASPEALRSIAVDPYWPKWNSPWWHMLLLFEVGKADLIPERAAQAMTEAIDSHFLHFFPLLEKDIPEGKDPYRHIACHCALGSAYQFLEASGVDVDVRLPWLRPWFLEHQLPDGGLNCDEQAYTTSKKSSIVSSLPVFEAVLSCAPKGLSAGEETFLDRAATYLIEHRLVDRLGGDLMDADFLKLQFPRFYSYDILRGLSFLVAWKKHRQSDRADEAIALGLDRLRKHASFSGDPAEGKLIIQRADFLVEKTLKQQKNDSWEFVAASTFPLLQELGRVGDVSPSLAKIYRELLI